MFKSLIYLTLKIRLDLKNYWNPKNYIADWKKQKSYFQITLKINTELKSNKSRFKKHKIIKNLKNKKAKFIPLISVYIELHQENLGYGSNSFFLFVITELICSELLTSNLFKYSLYLLVNSCNNVLYILLSLFPF